MTESDRIGNDLDKQAKRDKAELEVPMRYTPRWGGYWDHLKTEQPKAANVEQHDIQAIATPAASELNNGEVTRKETGTN